MGKYRSTPWLVKHGLTHTRYFHIWQHIKTRCYDPMCKAYPNYGGRGITLALEWVHDVESFCSYIKSLPGSDDVTLSLDRVDNNGNYERGNLRWATKQTQSLNKRVCLQNKTGYTGVYYDKIRDKFESSIVVNKVKIHLGRYLTAVDAHIARLNYISKNNIQL